MVSLKCCVILLVLASVVTLTYAGIVVPSLSEHSTNELEVNQEPRPSMSVHDDADIQQDAAERDSESRHDLFGDLNFRQKYHQLKERIIHGQLQPADVANSDLDQVIASSSNSNPKNNKNTNNKNSKEQLSPVILVPGYGGSRLEGKRDKAQVKHYFCEKHSDWSNIWIDLKLMLPYMIDCLIEDFRLEFEPKTNTTHNSQGVEIRVRDPGNLLTVEYLTDIHLPSFAYFAPIIRKLTHSFNYQRNENIRGAPYDFRKAPNELGEFFAQLLAQCEQLRRQFNQPITFICHSMGCNNVLYFLQHQSSQWKDYHIKQVISLAAPWGGSMQAVRATAFGDNLGLPYLFDEAELKKVQQSVPSTMYLYPNERVFRNAPLITMHTETSTTAIKTTTSSNDIETIRAADFKRFFELINHPEGYLMWLNTKDLLGQVEAPGVEVWCLYGSGHPTLGRMEFTGTFPGSQEEDFHEDGDGTVTVTSASFCKEWTSEQSQPIHAKAFGASHVDMIKDANVLDMIEQIFANSQ